MNKEITLNTCNHLAEAIDNEDESSVRVYSSALLGSLFNDFNNYEEVLDTLATSSGEELIGQARSIYSLTAMKTLMVGAGLGSLI